MILYLAVLLPINIFPIPLLNLNPELLPIAKLSCPIVFVLQELYPINMLFDASSIAFTT